ncbi:SMI1/KNR4 family protein [Stenotrophomonas sp. 278]|nr:SMI1/KNR4 family protein [Stenotrophomonas sp. 278]
MAAEDARDLVSRHGDIVGFGSTQDAVGRAWIEAAERKIGLEFSPSYLWFLRTYKGGEICGEEIFSVYGLDFDAVSGGDIVHQRELDQASGLMHPSQLVVSRTDLGEVFFFDYSDAAAGEVPIKLLLPSGQAMEYASDFYEFICKRIRSYI